MACLPYWRNVTPKLVLALGLFATGAALSAVGKAYASTVMSAAAL